MPRNSSISNSSSRELFWSGAHDFSTHQRTIPWVEQLATTRPIIDNCGLFFSVAAHEQGGSHWQKGPFVDIKESSYYFAALVDNSQKAGWPSKALYMKRPSFVVFGFGLAQTDVMKYACGVQKGQEVEE